MAFAGKLRAFGFAAGMAVLLASAFAELATWDQARAGAIAQQLASACEAWEQTLRQAPDATLGSGDSQAMLELSQQARLLHERSRSLASHLKDGKGHDDTRNQYRASKETVDDTEVTAQRAELDEPTLDAWAKVMDPFRQLSTYYDPKANEAGKGAAR